MGYPPAVLVVGGGGSLPSGGGGSPPLFERLVGPSRFGTKGKFPTLGGRVPHISARDEVPVFLAKLGDPPPFDREGGFPT